MISSTKISLMKEIMGRFKIVRRKVRNVWIPLDNPESCVDYEIFMITQTINNSSNSITVKSSNVASISKPQYCATQWHCNNK